MHYKLTFAGVVLILTGCTAVSTTGTDNRPLPQRSDLQHIRLANGMNVYLLSRPQPGAELRLLVESGSLQETEEQRGLAHFTEHMAFKGTTHFPDTQSFKQLEKQGLNLGSHVNAATSLNSTVYKLSLPQATPEQIQTGLQVLADWAQGMTFDPVAFDKERSVIIEEWRLRQGIGFRINNALEQLRYAGSLYAERDPIGLLDVIRHAPVSTAKDYYQTWYQPQRMSLVVIGQFNRHDVSNLAEAYFNQPAKEDAAQDDPARQRFAPHPGLLVKPVFDKEQGQRIMQFALQRDIRAPLNTRDGQYDDLLDNLWVTILNQRLTALVDNGQLPAANINPQGAMLDSRRLQQLMIVHPQGGDYLGSITLLWTEIQRLATQPVTQAELDDARQSLLAKLSQQAAGESRYGNDYLADTITTALEYRMPVQDKRQQLTTAWELLKPVTPDTLKTHVSGFLNQASPRLALLGPDSEQARFDEKAFTDRWQQIRQSAPGPFSLTVRQVALNVTPAAAGSIVQEQALPLPSTESWQLSNGLRVIVHQDKSLKDNIQINLRIPGGRSLEPAGQEGLTDWALKLPESSGYGELSARELTLFSKQHSLSLRPYSELLNHGFRGEAPPEELDTLLKLLHLKITQPQFSGEKLLRNQQLTLESLNSTPVERRFLDAINRESHTHGERLVINENGGWRQFTAAQLQQNHRLLLSPVQDMTLVISGAADKKQIKQAVEKWIATLPASGQRLQWRDPAIAPKMQSFSRTYPIASSDKTMVSIQYAAPAQWSLKESLTLQLADSIISKQLRSALREQAGGIYALSLSSMLAKLPSPYYSARLNFTTDPQRAAEMTALSRNVLKTLKTDGVSDNALKEARANWLLEKQQVYQSAAFWTESLAQIAGDDNEFTRITAEEALVNQITAEDINRALSRYSGENEKLFMLTPP
ncbi:insulinase family protein [Morganella morganii]|nr:insulinase family protein [Morganella morganii]